MKINNKKIRVVVLGGLGDALLATPIFKAFKKKYPNRKIIAYCPKEHAKVFEHNPYIDKIIFFYRNSISVKLMELGWRDYVSAAYGYLKPSLLYLDQKKAVDTIAEMVDVELEDKRVELFLTEAEETKAQKELSKYTNPVIIHITSLTSKNNEWFIEKWEQLVSEIPECTFIQLGTSQEKKVEGAIDYRGKTTFREALALLKYSISFVGVVSSLSHATNAFLTPGVVLFGASSPEVWGHDHNININKSLQCSPCIDFLHFIDCPYNKSCMQQISVQEVKNALKQQLSKITSAVHKDSFHEEDMNIVTAHLQKNRYMTVHD